MSALNILFEDRDIFVLSKPAGLGTQAPAAFDSLERRVRTYLTKFDESPYLGIPHRLDRCVSGCVVFAKRRKAAQRISKQFEERTVVKRYLALVSGIVTESAGRWQDLIRKIPNEPRAEIVADRAENDAKPAALNFEVVRTFTAPGSNAADDALSTGGVDGSGRLSELLIQLETGRMHQIRVQCSSRGHPVVGDRLYGSDIDFGMPPTDERQRKIALHATSISFVHPRSREEITFRAPTPSEWPDV